MLNTKVFNYIIININYMLMMDVTRTFLVPFEIDSVTSVDKLQTRWLTVRQFYH